MIEMMERVAQFEKIPLDQFVHDLVGAMGGKEKFATTLNLQGLNLQGDEMIQNFIEDIYDKIKLPKRLHEQSASYKFFAPFDVILKPNEASAVPSGIRVRLKPGWVLMLKPKYDPRIKYRSQIDHTFDIIDAEYYESETRGHIFISMHNHSPYFIQSVAGMGEVMAQGTFIPYGTAFEIQEPNLLTNEGEVD